MDWERFLESVGYNASCVRLVASADQGGGFIIGHVNHWEESAKIGKQLRAEDKSAGCKKVKPPHSSDRCARPQGQTVVPLVPLSCQQTCSFPFLSKQATHGACFPGADTLSPKVGKGLGHSQNL